MAGCILVALVAVVLLLARKRRRTAKDGLYNSDTANRDQVAFSNPLCKFSTSSVYFAYVTARARHGREPSVHR
jgi:hypothetical protein